MPRVVRIGLMAGAVLLLLAAANLAYQLARKPSELLAPMGGGLNKPPAETWRSYGTLFRRYSTVRIPPELLAALAQVEGSGNPLASTYWRWRFSWNPLAIYRPASSAVGTFQMTDGAFAEARRYCIRDHVVVEDGCWLNHLYSRVLPSHSIELAAVYLDRGVAAILAGRSRATSQQMQDLAAVVHLCGPGAARAIARRGFRVPAGERCGDHGIAAYLARVHAMERTFRRLAAED